MANNDDLDLDDQEPEGEGPHPMKLLIIVVAISLLMSGGIAAGFYFMTADEGASQVAEEDGDGGDDEEEEEEEEGQPNEPVLYHALDPAFVVNFQDQHKARFLQATIEVMVLKPETIEHINHHMPAIRNSIVMLFSSKTYDDLKGVEGKEQTRQEALAAIQDILEERTGDPGVEDVYFTGFVMQ